MSFNRSLECGVIAFETDVQFRYNENDLRSGGLTVAFLKEECLFAFSSVFHAHKYDRNVSPWITVLQVGACHSTNHLKCSSDLSKHAVWFLGNITNYYIFRTLFSSLLLLSSLINMKN